MKRLSKKLLKVVGSIQNLYKVRAIANANTVSLCLSALNSIWHIT